MKGKWIFRHHAPVGDRRTDKEMFFGVTNIRHPKGTLFVIEDGSWSSEWDNQYASSHDNVPMSLRAFKKYLRKHPELEVFGNVMSLCSRYRGLKVSKDIKENSSNMESYDCHIDAIFVPISKGFPKPYRNVSAFVLKDDGSYINETLYFDPSVNPNNFNFIDDDLKKIGKVLYWTYCDNGKIAHAPEGSHFE